MVIDENFLVTLFPQPPFPEHTDEASLPQNNKCIIVLREAVLKNEHLG
jgi:hypothetical protein